MVSALICAISVEYNIFSRRSRRFNININQRISALLVRHLTEQHEIISSCCSTIASTHFMAACPSHSSGRWGFRLSFRVSWYSFRIRCTLFPTSTLAPLCSRRVTGLSLFQRRVRQGVPSMRHYACSPPLSVSMIRASIFRNTISW